MWLLRIKFQDLIRPISLVVSAFVITYIVFDELGSTFGLNGDYSPFPLQVIRFGIWIVFLLLLNALSSWIIRAVWQTRHYRFQHRSWPEEWIFNGKPELTPGSNELYIKSTRAGTLLKYFWKNFEMTFQCKFADGMNRNFGIVLKAQDLANYFMLEIIDRDTNTYIKPHVRYDACWEVMEPKSIGKIDFSDYKNILIQVKTDTVVLKIEGRLVEQWILPTHVDINHIESGKPPKQNEKEGAYELLQPASQFLIPEIPFRLARGMVGFRANLVQGVIVKDLEVKVLP